MLAYLFTLVIIAIMTVIVIIIIVISIFCIINHYHHQHHRHHRCAWVIIDVPRLDGSSYWISQNLNICTGVSLKGLSSE